MSPIPQRLSSLPVLLACFALAAALPDSGEHGHGNMHAAPLLHLNETEVLQYHDPDPMSYYAHDYIEGGPSYRALMVAHIVGMCFAYWVLLPMVIALRIAKHPLRGLFIVFFQVAVTFSSFASTLYKKLTPDLSVHRLRTFPYFASTHT